MSKWMVAAKKADFYAIAQQYHISPVMARIIRNRDVKRRIFTNSCMERDRICMHRI